MIAAEDLIALVRNYNPKTNAEARLTAAYEFGKAMHEGQTRHSGEPYFTHPVAVAAILTEQRLDDATIITALLHDTIEDTKASYGEVAEAHFGDEVAVLVDGVTKLTNLQLSSLETKQAENFRKLFMAMSKDLRVILVKLADRLHNMRTIKAMKPEKQVQKARETMDILCAACGPHGHAVDARGAGRSGIPRPEPRGAAVDHPPVHHTAARNRRRDPPHHRRHARRAGQGRDRGRGIRPGQETLFHLAQDAGKGTGLLAAQRHLRLSRHHRVGRGLLSRAGRHPPALARGAGPVQGLYQPAQVERLSLDPHHRVGSRRQAGRGADPHPSDA